jgi:MATE family multidrug resistance protein
MGRGGDRSRLPALRLDAEGQRHVDMRAMLMLAAPLILNSTLQSILTLTDTWFIGRLSTAATAGMAGIQWLIVLFLFLLNGTTMGVQTLVAQAHGGRRHRRASRALWLGLWASLFTILPFLLIAGSGHAILSPFGLPGDIEALAVQYWGPRMVGGPLAIALWTLNAYFNGLGHTRLPLAITGVVAVSNVFLNEILMFHLGMGMAGAAWATTIAQGLGVLLAGTLMLRLEPERYQPLRTWRLRWRPLWSQVKLGLPMAASGVVDIGAAALFQLMQVRIGAVDGAATQITMMFTSLAYMPGIGMALIGTTLVGQSIGAGDREWAGRLGSRVIVTVAMFMGGLGLVVALLGSWLAPLFVNPADPHAAEVV